MTSTSLCALLDHVHGREGRDVIDPWHGDDEGFDITWGEAVQAAKGLAALIAA